MTHIANGFVKYLEIPAPELGNNTADVERLKSVLKKEIQTDSIFFPTSLATDFPFKLRHYNHKIKIVLFKDSRGWRVVDILAPDKEKPVLGIAVDLGTTRIVIRLINLETSTCCGEVGFDNPQLSIAPDVLARIHHARNKEGLMQLKELVISAINNNINLLCINNESIHLMTIAGNTAMTHLFLGIDTSFLIREPYIPAVNVVEPLDSLEIGIEINPRGLVYLFPNIGSYFGGDLISGILFAQIHKKESPSIMVDVGTNAEVVVGCRDWLIACAGAAGPALEGGISKIGMTAKPGVIDRVKIDPITRVVEIHTIGVSNPAIGVSNPAIGVSNPAIGVSNPAIGVSNPTIGICGSGMIDLAAELFLSGMLDIRGKFVPEQCGERYFEQDGIGFFCLVDNSLSNNGGDTVSKNGGNTVSNNSDRIVLSQVEMNSLTSSKAAMYSILQVLIEKIAGLRFDDLEKFYVAGTFGSFINPKSAISIGMLPDIPIDKFEVLGNSSLEGAAKLLIDPDLFEEIEAIRKSITYIELNVNQEFMNIFSGAKFYPHTDISRFPSVHQHG